MKVCIRSTERIKSLDLGRCGKGSKTCSTITKNAFTEGRKIKSNYGVTKKLESYLSSSTV